MDINQHVLQTLFDDSYTENVDKTVQLTEKEKMQYFFTLGFLDGFAYGQEDTLSVCQEDILEARKEFNEVDTLNKALAFRLKQLLEKVN
jgi:hypothetical protein